MHICFFKSVWSGLVLQFFDVFCLEISIFQTETFVRTSPNPELVDDDVSSKDPAPATREDLLASNGTAQMGDTKEVPSDIKDKLLETFKMFN